MRSSLARNIVRTFSTQVGCQAITILCGIAIARVIGPSGKGFISYAMTGVSFVSVFFYGFTDAILMQFGKERHSARAVHAVSIRILATIVVVVMGIFVAISFFLPSQRPLAAAAFALPFAMYIQMMTPFLLVRDKLLFLNLQMLGQSIGVSVLTIALLVFTRLGLLAVVAVWILCYALSALCTALEMARILKSPAPAETSPSLLAQQLHFGIRAAGSSTAGFLNMRISTFVVSIVLAPVALGWYTLAIGTGELLWQVSRAFAWSALGRIGTDSLDDAAALIARLTRNTLAIVGAFGIIAFAIGPQAICTVYGKDFAPAGAALRWALPGLIAYAAEVALTKFIILQLRRPITVISVQLSAAVMCAGMTILGTPRYGIIAAAAATSVTYLVVTAILLGIFYQGTKIPMSRLLILQPEDIAFFTRAIRNIAQTLRTRFA